jgi:hypothetical protein
VNELRAQLLHCDKILGRVSDTGSAGDAESRWGRAVHQVNDEFGVVYNFYSSPATPDAYVKHIRDAQRRGEEWARYYPANRNPATQPDAKWASRKITAAAGTTAYIDLLTDSIANVEKNYDPVRSSRR